MTGRGPGSVRIAGGELKGRRLAVPTGIRPTGARLREALFSIWSARVPGSRFLDLFAGSGAVGLEALSRGARQATLVEGDPRVARITRRNVEAVGLEARVVRARLPRELDRLGEGPFDLVFADPPYRFESYPGLLEALSTRLAVSGCVAVEHAARVELPVAIGALETTDQRTYGDSRLTIYGLADGPI